MAGRMRFEGQNATKLRRGGGSAARRRTRYHRRPARPVPTSHARWRRWFSVAEKRAAKDWVFLPPTATGRLEKWLAPQRQAAIARIVEAVGKAPRDEMRLAADISRAYHEQPAYGEKPLNLFHLEGAEAQKRLKKVRRILKGVEKQAGLIDFDLYIKAVINKVSTPFEIPTVQQLLLKLRSLEELLKWLAKQWRSKADLPENLRDRRPSQFEWLVGVSLPLVYERHFSLRAARSRNLEGTPSGPMIHFIDATMRELGIAYKPELIMRAFTRLTPLRDEERTKKGGK